MKYFVSGALSLMLLSCSQPSAEKMLAEKRYDTMDDMPTWAKPTVGKLLNKDILQGNGKGLDLSMDMMRMLVILDRAGSFGR